MCCVLCNMYYVLCITHCHWESTSSVMYYVLRIMRIMHYALGVHIVYYVLRITYYVLGITHWDVDKCKELRPDDNTEVAEQGFAWLARSKHVFRTMNESRFLFTILRLMHMRNRYTAGMPFHP